MATITTHRCDLCQKPATHLQEQVQIVFTTEQTEGRPTKPHLSIERLDLCDKCLQQIIDSNPVLAHGAQGHNTYYWKP
jgi:hypothetical protein